nr:hypothetical protein [Tanacetum cinerariifolium]
MSTQQDFYAAGSESHPPMLNKENYVPWSSRLLRYAKSRPNGKLIHNSILNGPYVRKMISEPGDANREITVTETFHLQTDDELSDKELKQIEADDQAIQTILLSLPEDIYAAVDSCETAQEIWLRFQQMMKGSDIGIQEKKAKLFNKWERQIAQPGMNMGQDRQMQMVREEYDLMAAAAELDEIKEVNENCILMANLQQASTSGTQSNCSSVYDTDGSAECGQGGKTVEQHPENFEEIRALYESLYQNLAIKVKKVNSVNRKLKETNADLTIELISELNKQLSKENSTVSFLLEEKKRLKSDFKTYEDKLLDKQIELEKKIKDLNNIVFKMGQSIQTINMLSPKPDSFYHTEQKMALGCQNPFYLKQAQKKQQSLYDGKVLLAKQEPIVVYDSEETLQLAQESRQKMKQMNKEIKPANYMTINHLSGVFVPQSALSREELYFSNLSKTATVSKSISIPNEVISDDTTPSVARKFLNEAKSTIVTLQRVVKQRMTIETHNWASSAHQEFHKIVREEILPIVNQVDARVQNFEIQFLKEAAKFVGDFKSLAKKADSSLAKHKILELDFEHLLKAVVSQDILSVVQNASIVVPSDLQTELERTKEHFENCIIKRKQNMLNFGMIGIKSLFKKDSVEKENTQDTSKNTKFAKQPIVETLPKIGETNALSKPVTSNSVSTPQVSKGVNNAKVIAPGMFKISPDKVSREAKKVPNTVNYTKTRRPQPRSNTKNDRVPSASKSSQSLNKDGKVEEHHRNLLLSKKNKHSSSACNNSKIDSLDVISKVVCAICKKCSNSANHDECLVNYVNDKKSRGRKHRANVSMSETQKAYRPKVSKSKIVGTRESLATPKPRKPRFLLRWSPTGKMFDSAGKLVATV